jgi:hypothetical protein
VGTRNALKILVRKPLEEISHVRMEVDERKSLRMDFRYIDCEDDSWMKLAYDCV